MLELRRNNTPLAAIMCDASGELIQPYEWYYYDTERKLNIKYDVVVEWKTKALEQLFADRKTEVKEYELTIKQQEIDKKGLVNELKSEIIDGIINNGGSL